MQEFFKILQLVFTSLWPPPSTDVAELRWKRAVSISSGISMLILMALIGTVAGYSTPIFASQKYFSQLKQDVDVEHKMVEQLLKDLNDGQKELRQAIIDSGNANKAQTAFGQLTMLYLRQCEANRAGRFSEAIKLGEQIAPLLRDYQIASGVPYPGRPC